MFKARQKELRPYHITPQQANTLIFLYNLGQKATLSELARNANRGISALSIQMTRMGKDELVKKVRETHKSNLLIYEMTDKGLLVN